jgi:endonuclease/exonuclease/phosphatase family metal-dependent hydrolase
MSTALMVVFLGLLSAGCVSHRPRPVVVRAPEFERVSAQQIGSDLQLELVTFNIWGLPSWATGASPERYARIASELEALNPDFIALQEVWTRRSREAVPHSKDWWISAPAKSQGFFRWTGLVTVSRYPVLGGKFYPFRAQRLPDKLVSKGALKTTIALAPGVLVNLWNVHMQSGKCSKVRSRQIAELAAWVRQARDGQMADLVVGDFNSEPGSAEYAQLTLELGPGSLDIGQSKPFATYGGMPKDKGAWCSIDHMFIRLRQSAQPVLVDSRPIFKAEHPSDRLSDHLGVEVDVSLPFPAGFNTRRPVLALRPVAFQPRDDETRVPARN